MRKTIFLLLFLGICVTYSDARSPIDTVKKESNLSIGIAGGMNLSLSNYFISNGYTSPYGSNAGLVIKIKVGKNISLSSGVAFNQLTNYFGISVNYLPWYDSPSPYMYKHDHAFFSLYSIPLYFTFQSKKGKKLKFLASLGAEEFFWNDKYSFITGDNLQLKTFFGLKLGGLYKITNGFSISLEAGAKKNIHIYRSSDKYGSTTSADVHRIIDLNVGLFYTFQKRK